MVMAAPDGTLAQPSNLATIPTQLERAGTLLATLGTSPRLGPTSRILPFQKLADEAPKSLRLRIVADPHFRCDAFVGYANCAFVPHVSGDPVVQEVILEKDGFR
jgi:hypothetical protein